MGYGNNVHVIKMSQKEMAALFKAAERDLRDMKPIVADKY